MADWHVSKKMHNLKQNISYSPFSYSAGTQFTIKNKVNLCYSRPANHKLLLNNSLSWERFQC